MMQTFDKSAWYTIAAKVSGKVIEAENASTENGAAVCLSLIHISEPTRLA